MALLVAQRGGEQGATKSSMTPHDSTAAPQLNAPSTCTLKIHHCHHSRIGPYQQIPGLLDHGTFALHLRLWFLELVAPSDTLDAD
jgi:hypothetical protein